MIVKHCERPRGICICLPPYFLIVLPVILSHHLTISQPSPYLPVSLPSCLPASLPVLTCFPAPLPYNSLLPASCLTANLAHVCAGAHVVWMSGDKGAMWGCGPGWGGIEIILVGE